MKWRYEESTKTIRSIPENYWIATMDSWDGAVNHAANSRLIAAAPDMLEALNGLFEHCSMIHKHWGDNSNQKEAENAIKKARAAINKATGK